MRNINARDRKSLKNAAKLAKELNPKANKELIIDKDVLIKTVNARLWSNKCNATRKSIHHRVKCR